MAKTYREIEAWQLAAELRQRIVRLCLQPSVTQDRKFCEQMKDSAASVARNIAEGFGRYNPAEFARFLSIARGSLDETDNHLRDGVERSYYPPEVAAPLVLLGARCRSAISALEAYLRKRSTQEAFARKPRS